VSSGTNVMWWTGIDAGALTAAKPAVCRRHGMPVNVLISQCVRSVAWCGLVWLDLYTRNVVSLYCCNTIFNLAGVRSAGCWQCQALSAFVLANTGSGKLVTSIRKGLGVKDEMFVIGRPEGRYCGNPGRVIGKGSALDQVLSVPVPKILVGEVCLKFPRCGVTSSEVLQWCGALSIVL